MDEELPLVHGLACVMSGARKMPRGKFPDSKLNALVRFNVEIIWDQTCLRKLPPAVGAVLFRLLRPSKLSDGVPLIYRM